MRFKVNDEPVELPEGSSIDDLAKANNLPEKGVAIAVNNEMVPLTQWKGKVIAEGDDIIIIRAVCGG
ncbi:MAG: sulfur carrier protein ThiS [Paludibacteraceae bacterium]|nr:sulfur carrier protein ThiS [Paludibacteraceae bacterium]